MILPVLLGWVSLELEACPWPLELLAPDVSLEAMIAKLMKALEREYNI